MLPIRKLFQRRLGYRLHILAELIKINFDWWEALYILVPGLAFTGSAYLDLLSALPDWFLPDYLLICTAIIILMVVRGIPRTYLVRADLVHIFHNTRDFNRLWSYGQVISIMLKTLPFTLLLFLVFPFYHHIQGVSPAEWLLLSCWAVFIKLAVLVLNGRLYFTLSKWGFRLAQGLSIMALWAVWTRLLPTFLESNGTSLIGLLVSIGFCFLVVIILMCLLPDAGWERVISREESCDMAIMRKFLGFAAQAEQKASKSGQARFWRGRLGIGFKKERVFSYFFIKYFLRNSSLWKLYGQIYLITLLLILTVPPMGVKMLLVGGALAVTALLTETVWKEHTGDLYLRMLPMQWTDLSHGIKLVFALLLLPYGMLIWLAALGGVNSWLESLIGAVAVSLVAWYLAGYFSSKVAVWFNYERVEA